MMDGSTSGNATITSRFLSCNEILKGLHEVQTIKYRFHSNGNETGGKTNVSMQLNDGLGHLFLYHDIGVKCALPYSLRHNNQAIACMKKVNLNVR